MPDNVHRVKLYKRRRAAVLALPDRAPDRDRVRATGPAALGRRDRDRPHRSARLGRRQLARAPPRAATSRTTAFNTNLEAADEIARQLAPARPGRPDRHRLHRHGEREEPARSRESPARRAEVRPCARAARQDLALRTDGAVAPAAASGACRIGVHPLPALPRHRPHPRHRIDRAAHPPHHPGGGDEGQHGADRRAGAGRRRDVPAEREAHRRAVDRDALQGERAAGAEPPSRNAELHDRAAAPRRPEPERAAAAVVPDGRAAGRSPIRRSR